MNDLESIVKAIEASAETMKAVGDSITNLHNRQDTVWKIIQALLDLMNKNATKVAELEQAIINMGKEIRDGERIES